MELRIDSYKWKKIFHTSRNNLFPFFKRFFCVGNGKLPYLFAHCNSLDSQVRVDYAGGINFINFDRKCFSKINTKETFEFSKMNIFEGIHPAIVGRLRDTALLTDNEIMERYLILTDTKSLFDSYLQ